MASDGFSKFFTFYVSLLQKQLHSFFRKSLNRSCTSLRSNSKLDFTALWKETTPREIKNRKSSFQNNLFFQERCTKYFMMGGGFFSLVIYLLPVDQLSKRIKSKSRVRIDVFFKLSSNQ